MPLFGSRASLPEAARDHYMRCRTLYARVFVPSRPSSTNLWNQPLTSYGPKHSRRRTPRPSALLHPTSLTAPWPPNPEADQTPLRCGSVLDCLRPMSTVRLATDRSELGALRVATKAPTVITAATLAPIPAERAQPGELLVMAIVGAKSVIRATTALALATSTVRHRRLLALVAGCLRYCTHSVA